MAAAKLHFPVAGSRSPKIWYLTNDQTPNLLCRRVAQAKFEFLRNVCLDDPSCPIQTKEITADLGDFQTVSNSAIADYGSLSDSVSRERLLR